MGSKWLLIALVASVAVNLALVGYLAGRASAGDIRPNMLDPMLGFTALLRELPEQRRNELRPLVREQFRAMQPSVRSIRLSQTKLAEAIAAEPFEAERLAAALGEFRSHLMTSQNASHDAFARLIGALSVEERRQLLTSLRRRDSARGRRVGPRPGLRGGSDAQDRRPGAGPGTDPGEWPPAPELR